MKMNIDKTKVMRISREPFPLHNMIDQKLENVEYFSCLGTMMTNNVRIIREIKSRIAMAKEAFSRKKGLFTSIINLRKTLSAIDGE
jgi:hypothetical protein